MANPVSKLEAKALVLPPELRARFAERLISSLDLATDADAEEIWIREAERRLEDRIERVRGRSGRAGHREGTVIASGVAVAFRPEAEAEFIAAAHYYERQTRNCGA